MGHRMRQRQIAVPSDYLLFRGSPALPGLVAGDQVDVEGARSPALTADPARVPLEFLGPA